MGVVQEKHVREMEEQGFTVFERLFSQQETEAIAEVLSGYEARRRAELAAHGGTESISRASEITFTSHLAENDPDVMAFVKRPEFLEIGTTLLNTDALGLYWNQTVFKMPEGDKLFPWHQDDAYTRVEPCPYLTLWLALNDATLENGCVSVLPGSHKKGFVEHTQTSLGWECHSADDPNQGVPAPVPAGSVIAFWSLTMHKSAPNRSKGIRKAYIVQVAPMDLKNMASGEPITMAQLN